MDIEMVDEHQGMPLCIAQARKSAPVFFVATQSKKQGVKRKVTDDHAFAAQKKVKLEKHTGFKRAASNELGGPTKKRKIVHEGILPWGKHNNCAHLEAYIAIKEDKPICLLKELENKEELVCALGALLSGDTVMVPVCLSALSRMFCGKKINLNYFGFSPEDGKHHPLKITHLPESFVSLLREDEPFEIFLPASVERKDIPLWLIPAQKKLGLSQHIFEHVYKVKTNNANQEDMSMMMEGAEEYLPDLSVISLSSPRVDEAHGRG